MQQQELIKHIEYSILEFGQKFVNKKYRYAFFGSEGSVKCYLYSLIARKNGFLEDIKYTTEENEKITTWHLHAELPTFEKINSKNGRFDICVINPDKYEKDNVACIEIEWASNINNRIYSELKTTLDKLSNPKNEVENGYLIILNDNNGFTKKDIASLTKLKEQYSNVKFFIFDAVSDKSILASELIKNGKAQY